MLTYRGKIVIFMIIARSQEAALISAELQIIEKLKGK